VVDESLGIGEAQPTQGFLASWFGVEVRQAKALPITTLKPIQKPDLSHLACDLGRDLGRYESEGERPVRGGDGPLSEWQNIERHQ
jgi:hypothetical protein